MFSKILIANRGEIACRVARAARALGVKTVAVFSDADANALHVHACDEAVHLGPSPARESYLNVEKVLAAARNTGAQAVHPGYGFLSEQAEFAQACAGAGIVFVGPPPGAMRAIKDKAQARAVMRNAGVPVVPGSEGHVGDENAARAAAGSVGYPLLVKAAAGGGGIGMRIVEEEKDLPAAFEACRRAALSSFGDDTVYLERYLEQPRHIEMQILADAYGTTLALGERECSIQRRHQKLVEETPAPGLPQARREAMSEAAVRAAGAVGYRNAGTIEFIVSGEDFYFLEMNTRLQVEHPITETVLGIDLVREQIRIAAGDRLEPQAHGPRGHAIEFRINAEDPTRNFLPAPRRIRRYAPPSGPGVRVDAGIRPHQEVSPHFDPLLAKLIVFGATRQQAIERGRRALEEFVLTGPATTIPFHRALLEEPDFLEGRISTHFIADHPALMERTGAFAGRPSPLEPLYGNGELAAIAAAAAVSQP